MWIVCITSVRHVLTVNGYGGRQTKENEKSWCFKGWETLGVYYSMKLFSNKVLLELCNNLYLGLRCKYIILFINSSIFKKLFLIYT